MYISLVTLFVHDVDRAIDFYTRVLGWEKRDDAEMAPGMRWVTVGPSGEKTSFVLAHGFGGWSPEKVGGATGTVLEVDDVEASVADLSQRGVEFSAPPRVEPWGLWAEFKDSEGNEFGLHSEQSTLAGINI
jgi:predicted enzyme related to lactoylglutathione lyase